MTRFPSTTRALWNGNQLQQRKWDQAKGPMNWPHSQCATRAKIAELALAQSYVDDVGVHCAHYDAVSW